MVFAITIILNQLSQSNTNYDNSEIWVELSVKITSMEIINQSLVEVCQKLSAVLDEKEIVRILLHYSMEIAGVSGASFVSLDDWGYPLSIVRQGDIPSFLPEAWLEYLATPLVREKCSQCMQRGRLVTVCPLLEGPFSEALGVYCLPVRYAGHELGVMNLFLTSREVPQSDQVVSLQFLVNVAAISIANDRLRRRELAMFSKYSKMRQKSESGRFDDQSDAFVISEDQLAEIEYKAQIEERARLAREIHDGLAQTLGFLKLQAAQIIGNLEKCNPERLRQLSTSLYDALSEAYLDAREAINMLRVIPGEPSAAHLGNWLSQIVEEYRENTDIEVRIQEFSAQTSLPGEVHLQLIRIFQEALTNVRKHAQAQQVIISCRELDHRLVVEIQDDGIGFHPDAIPELSKHGLRGMQERADLIGAHLELVSQPGEGTLLRLSLPIRDNWIKQTL